MRHPALRSRYPGIQPFSAEQSELFFGRDSELHALERLVRLEPLVVLYGKSGSGKTSLIHAGLLLNSQQMNWDSYVFRFGAFGAIGYATPSIYDRLVGVLESRAPSQSTYLDQMLPAGVALAHPIWTHLKSREIAEGHPRQYLLIFDQFEEVFTWPSEQVNVLKEELAHLYKSWMPNLIRQELLSDGYRHTGLVRTILEPLRVKVLITIRSDNIHLLNAWSDHLPDILRNTFELSTTLSSGHAREALIKPAALQGEFSSPPFAFSEEALNDIMNALNPDGEGVMPVQLQILGQYLERQQEEYPNGIVTPMDLPSFDVLFSDFYKNSLDSLPQDEYLPARRLIEEGLLFEEKDGRARRLIVDGELLMRQFEVSQDLMQRLLDTHLLRPEPNPRGGISYELAHDSLVGTILQSKNLRLDEERRYRQHIENAQLGTELHRERRRRRRAFILFILLVFSILFNLLLLYLFLSRY